MTTARLCLLGLVMIHAAVPAALVRVPNPPPLPFAGFEPNIGQAPPDVLFLGRGTDGVAVTSTSMIFATVGVRQHLVGGSADANVRFLNQLPGVVNTFSGGDEGRTTTGAPRYAAALVENVYPGVDIQYELGPEGRLMQRILLDPGANPGTIVFELPTAHSVAVEPDGSLRIHLTLGTKPPGPELHFAPPIATQTTPSGSVSSRAEFRRLTGNQYTIEVSARNETLPLEIGVTFNGQTGVYPFISERRQAFGDDDSVFVAATVAAAPGKPGPFPEMGWSACSVNLYMPVPCTDALIYKTAANGDLIFATYLEGRMNSEAVFVGLAADGSVVAAGNTDSNDFPTTPGALQPNYAGPPVMEWYDRRIGDIRGDFFAARLDPHSGELLAATYLGGPNGDQMGDAGLGTDGSLYFFHDRLSIQTDAMPTSPAAIQADCPDPCRNGYAARVNRELDRLLYGTYLPGNILAPAALHSDGSLYYAGSAVSGFPTTPTAYQREPSGGVDGFIARLDPLGQALRFATYVGGPDTDWVSRLALAPDGSVWAAVTSFIECCSDGATRLVRLNADGDGLLADLPIDVRDIAVGPDGALHAIASGDFIVSPNALVGHACEPPDLAYIRLSTTGLQQYASYLPARTASAFSGTGKSGLPLLSVFGPLFELVEEEPQRMFIGCLVDGAAFTSKAPIPGQIVTLFGSGLGPDKGVAFELEGGSVPTSVAGVRLLVNGIPAPILYASYWQINAIVPYSVAVGTRPQIEVEYLDERAEPLTIELAERAAIELFRLNESADRPAAAINQDGTVNTACSPAKPGSVVALFGTGAGSTIPPSDAGEVTPLELRQLERAITVRVLMLEDLELAVEFAGAAPGLVAGVTQINVRVPEEIPEVPGYAPGLLPIAVTAPGSAHISEPVTIAVEAP